MIIHVHRNGAPLGQFSELEVQQKLQQSSLLPDDLYWVEGMAGWEPLRNRFSSALPPTPRFSQPPDELASPGSRLMARLIDGAIGLVISLPAAACFVWLTHNMENGEDWVLPSLALFAAFCVTILPFGVYNLILFVKRGQTVGKRIMGIRIVCNKSGSVPSWVRSILLREVVTTIISNVTFGLYGLVNLLFVFSGGNRCLHDRMANTSVKKGQPHLNKPFTVAGIVLW